MNSFNSSSLAIESLRHGFDSLSKESKMTASEGEAKTSPDSPIDSFHPRRLTDANLAQRFFSPYGLFRDLPIPGGTGSARRVTLEDQALAASPGPIFDFSRFTVQFEQKRASAKPSPKQDPPLPPETSASRNPSQALKAYAQTPSSGLSGDASETSVTKPITQRLGWSSYQNSPDPLEFSASQNSSISNKIVG